MVAKISVGSSLFGALSYNQNKVDEQQGKVLLSNRMFESEDGNFSIRRCMECFDMHLPADLKTEKPIIHISLNPHPDDVLSDSQLADIAKEYMDKLGYGNQPYMVYKHEDIARHHIHIVSIRVDDTGKKINDKFELSLIHISPGSPPDCRVFPPKTGSACRWCCGVACTP